MTGCNLCGANSDYAVHALISTKRKSPRAQKCSEAVSFCNRCMHSICEQRGAQMPATMMQALRVTYAALTSTAVSSVGKETR